MSDSTSSSNTATAPNVLTAAGGIDPSVPLTELHLADGRVLRVPTSFLHPADLSPAGTGDPDRNKEPRSPANAFFDSGGDRIPVGSRVPILEERLHVSRETVPTGTVRLHKTVESYTTTLDEPLAVRTYDIERIVLNQVIETAPGIRTEGDTTVYPVVEEQAIVTKQLVLKEEIRVTRRDTERRDQQTVTLRREHVDIEREAISASLPATVLHSGPVRQE